MYRQSQWRPSTALRKRRARYLSVIDVSGLASIMVFLVAMFIVWVSEYVDLPRNAVDLAVTHFAKPVPSAKREDALWVTVARDSGVFFGNQQITTEELPSLLGEGMNSGSEHRVFLKVNARSRYREVKSVLDQIRPAGIENIVLITYQRDPQASP
jgi:biopolymer transport protein TolR